MLRSGRSPCGRWNAQRLRLAHGIQHVPKWGWHAAEGDRSDHEVLGIPQLARRPAAEEPPQLRLYRLVTPRRLLLKRAEGPVSPVRTSGMTPFVVRYIEY